MAVVFEAREILSLKCVTEAFSRVDAVSTMERVSGGGGRRKNVNTSSNEKCSTAVERVTCRVLPVLVGLLEAIALEAPLAPLLEATLLEAIALEAPLLKPTLLEALLHFAPFILPDLAPVFPVIKLLHSLC